MVTAKWIQDWQIPDPAQSGIAEYRKIRQEATEQRRARINFAGVQSDFSFHARCWCWTRWMSTGSLTSVPVGRELFPEGRIGRSRPIRLPPLAAHKSDFPVSN